MSFDGWDFRQKHDITSGTPLTDYQVQFTVYKGSGTSSGSSIYLNTHCNDDFSDVRFSVDDSTSLPYWIESYTSGVSAVFWVKLPSISTTLLSVYYGKSDATSESNGTNTFEFFDDFATSTLDVTTKWTVNSGQPYSISGGILTVSGVGDTNDYIRSQTSFPTERSLMLKSRWNNAIGSSYFGLSSGSTSYIMFWDTGGSAAYAMKDGVSTQAGTPSTGSTLYLYEIQRRSSSSLQLIRNGVTLLNPTSTYITTIDLPITLREYGNGYSQAHDYIIVRKISATDPTQSTWYTEEFLGIVKIELSCDSPSGTCPFTSSIDLTLFGISTLTNCDIIYGDGETEHVDTIDTSPYTFTHLYDRMGTYTVSATGYSYSTEYSTTVTDLITTTYPTTAPYFTWTPKYAVYYEDFATFEKFYTPVQSYYSEQTDTATIILPDWYGTEPWAICKHGSNTLVSIYSGYYGGYSSIYVYDSDNDYVTSFGTYGSGNGQFGRVSGIAIDSSNNVFIVDRTNNRVTKFDASYNFATTFGSYGTGNGQFDSPCGIAIDSLDNIYVADTGNYRVQKFNSSGVYTTQVGSYGTGNGQFKYPYGVAIDSSNNVYVSDGDNGNLQKFNSSLSYVSKITGLTAYYLNVAIDKSNDYIYVDRYQGTSGGIYVYDSSYNSITSITTDATNIISVSIDASSNIYLLDKTSKEYYVYDPPVLRWSDANGYEWNFGDGTTSTELNPTHKFQTNGTLTVTLSAIASDYSRLTYSRNVVVNLRYVIAKFSYVPTTVYENDQITFVNSSEYNSENISTVTYLWKFGDGTTSTDTNPYKSYLYYIGEKTITLTAIGDGIHRDSTSQYITINPTVYPTVTTEFSIAYNDSDLYSKYRFSNSYDDMIIDDSSNLYTLTDKTVSSFGSGSTIVHTNVGDYTEKYLRLTSDFASISFYEASGYYPSFGDFIVIDANTFDEIYRLPIMQHSPSNYSSVRMHQNGYVYARIDVWPVGSVPEDPYTIYIYETDGTLITSKAMNFDAYGEIVDNVYDFDILPNGDIVALVDYSSIIAINKYDENLNFISTICYLDSVNNNYINIDSYQNIWNSTSVINNDGTFTTHLFKFSDGTYPLVYNFDFVHENSSVLSVYGPRAYDLRFSNVITFSDTSIGEPIEWYWDFGDGSNSTDQNPTHVFDAPGTYTVTLYSSNDHNDDSKSHTVFVSNPFPTVTIIATPEREIIPSKVSFTPYPIVNNSIHESIVAYIWLIDGETYTVQYPSHYYIIKGTHNVSLTVVNNYGEIATTTISFTLGELPTANFKPSSFSVVSPVLPYSVQFTNLSYPTDLPTTYLWDFGDMATSSSYDPAHSFASIGMYDVSLTVTNPYGTDTITYNDAIRMTRKSRTMFETVSGADSFTSFGVEVFTENSYATDLSIVHANIFPESFNIIQREIPDEPGVDEWGILNIYRTLNTIGSRIWTSINEWGHKILRLPTFTDSTGFIIYDAKIFEETVHVTDDHEFDETP